MSNLSSPIATQERANILDILRGFALLGILINNSWAFGGFMFMPEEGRALLSNGIDEWISWIQIALVEGKFYTLFSLLFGIGFSIILVRNEQRGVNPLKVFYRRILILLVIGFCHFYFLWVGDILLLYALIGLVLPLFRKLGNRALLTWAVVLILSPILIDVIRLLLKWDPGAPLADMGFKTAMRVGMPLDAEFPYYIYRPAAGYHEIFNFNQTGAWFRYEMILNSNRIPKVLGIFLIGLYAGRKMIYSKLEENRSLLRKVRNWGFIIGIPTNFALAYFENDHLFVPQHWKGLLDTVIYAIGVVPLSLAYVAAISLWFMRKKQDSKLNILAPVGRMALTNYIGQTIICIIIFYGIGFGMGTTISYASTLLIVAAIYLFQVLVSNAWFKAFNYGPLEWIWRQLTYGKRLPLRKLNN